VALASSNTQNGLEFKKKVPPQLLAHIILGRHGLIDQLIAYGYRKAKPSSNLLSLVDDTN